MSVEGYASQSSNPSPVAIHRAHSGPSSSRARVSYSDTSSGVSVSIHRPLTPLLMNTWAPASQKAPPKRVRSWSRSLSSSRRTILEDGVPPRFVDRDIEKGGDAAHLSRHIALQVRKVNEQDVGEIPNRPPGADIFPERPERKTVAIHPVSPVLPDILKGRFDGRSHPSGCLVQGVIPDLVRVDMMIVHTPYRIASVMGAVHAHHR